MFVLVAGKFWICFMAAIVFDKWKPIDDKISCTLSQVQSLFSCTLDVVENSLNDSRSVRVCLKELAKDVIVPACWLDQEKLEITCIELLFLIFCPEAAKLYHFCFHEKVYGSISSSGEA